MKRNLADIAKELRKANQLKALELEILLEPGTGMTERDIADYKKRIADIRCS